MRRRMMECTDKARISQFLYQARIGFLGFSNEAYVVPLNFVWHNGSLYFHCANEGRKIELMDAHSYVCFTVCEEYGTIVDPQPANTDTSYFSVMAFGDVGKVTDLTESTQVLQAMLEKYTPGYFQSPLVKRYVENYRSSLGSPVEVFKLTATEITAKENTHNANMAFYPGRTVADDVKRKIQS